MEGMARNYSENLASNHNDPMMMRKKAAKFESVKGPQIIPVPSIWNIVPPGLHVTLDVAPSFVSYCEVTADLLDEEVDEAVLAGVGDIIDMREESGEEEAEEEKEAEDKEAPATTIGSSKAYSEDRVKLELEVQEAKIKVQEADLEVQQLNKEVLHRMNILRRIEMNSMADSFKQQGKNQEAKAKWSEVEALSKSENSIKRFRSSFRFCGKLCLLTGHDHKIREELCTSCRLSCHSECELWDAMEAAVPAADGKDDAEDAMDVEDADNEEGTRAQGEGEKEEAIAEGGLEDARTCNDCRTRFQGFGEMIEVVRPWLLESKDKKMAALVVLERARAKEQAKSEELKSVVGPRRRELIRLLEEELHVVKTAYQGGTYVGNHCTQILVHHEKLSAVLASTTRPEIQENFNKIASTYLRIHHLMKAARWLTTEEVISYECRNVLYCDTKVVKSGSFRRENKKY